MFEKILTVFEDLLDRIEDLLRRRKSNVIQKKKKEKRVVLKGLALLLFRSFLRIIFYFLLIAGGWTITVGAELDSLNISHWFLYTIIIIVIIVTYEYLDIGLQREISRLEKKAHQKYGPSLNNKKNTK